MIKRLKSSLTAKIFFITAAMLVTICVLTYGFIAWVMPLTYRANLNSELSAKAEQLVARLQKSTLGDCQPVLNQFTRTTNANVYIESINNKTVKYSAGSTSGSITEATAKAGGDSGSPQQGGKGVQITSEKETAAATQCYQFHFLSDDNTYNLIIAMEMRTVNQAAEALHQVFPWLILAVLAVSFIGALFYSRYITRPVVKINNIAKKMSEFEFESLCDDNRSDEIGMLGKSLNELARKLSKALTDLRDANLLLQNDIDKERELERQRLEFFSAVSHELKTPITVIKGQLEGMLENIGVYKDHETYLSKCLSVTSVMEDTVQEILTVTRMGSSGFTPKMQPLDLTWLVQKQLDGYRDFMEQKYLSLQAYLAPGLMVSGDGKLLQKAVSNLLSNAVRYSPMEEKIIVRTSCEKGSAVLSVENTGVHIPENSIPHLFEAFFRVEQSRNRRTGGSGLGLYLVFRIAKLHGAECKIANTQKGVCAALSFPLTQT